MPSPDQPPHATGPTAVSMVGFRNADDVRHCVATLAEGSDPNFVVLICENGGRAGFDDLVAGLATLAAEGTAPAVTDPAIATVWRGTLPGGQVVEALCAADNLGYAGGVNATIARLAAFPDWSALWVLNADTEPDRDALAALVRKARSDPRYGIVGSRLVLFGTGKIQAYGGRWRKYTARGFNIGLGRPAEAPVDAGAVEREMTYVLGASMYITHAFIDEVGGMTEDYFLYVEEVDWCLRRGRFRLGLAADSIIHHHHGGTLGSSTSRRARSRLAVYLEERNKHLISRRLYPALYPLVALTTLVFTAQYIRARAPRNFVIALEGWWAGLRGESGKPAWMR
ncbi:glycosyltransferase family 2 protein [Lichenihabitans sp. Uapishka_5]|uniref:glycosyltransferase family 2 protein n=1 Tax=Lichenihabitans sp. Uapishka_5 TaxID=3037302 RepID=UPI0029E81BCB|nr:glycosyltransferase family 2 protein [Lichenihabitans sp. Uapishka_5]MDX7951705.1 glycosyltransferase family 2 protein [Lichenihabitans sp. Uapishka_5]